MRRAAGERRRYQREVERQLARIRERAHELELLELRGVGGRALAEPTTELERARRRLAALVARAPMSPGRRRRPIPMTTSEGGVA